jgi:hypothetical protein
MTQANLLEYCQLKVIVAVAKKGQSLDELFKKMDVDSSGFRKYI